MTHSDSISLLYNLDIVNGEQYLYCVEHDIITVQDLYDAHFKTPDDDFLKTIFESAKENDCFTLVGNENQLSGPIQEDLSYTAPINTEDEILCDIKSLISDQSARTRHVLEFLLFSSCNGSLTQFADMLYSPDFSAKDIRNIGRKSLPEVENCISEICSLMEQAGISTRKELPADTISKSIINESDAERIEANKSCIMNEMFSLSVRTKNVLQNLLENSCSGSIVKFYSVITSPDFDPKELRNIGKRSLPEISQFVDFVQSLITSDSTTEEELAKNRKVRQWVDAGIVERKDVDFIQRTYEKVGHFPLYSAIGLFINNLDERHRLITQTQLFIYEYDQYIDRSQVAAQLRLTPERIRQLRVKCLERIKNHIIKFKHQVADLSSYYNLDDLSNVNAREEVSFSASFCYWVLSLINPDYSVIGDAQTCFYNPYGKELKLEICSTKLNKIFDFKSFISSFDELYNSKHYDDIDIVLTSYLDKFFRKGIVFESREEIHSKCIQIIRDSYPCIFNGNHLVIQSNAIRNIPDLVEQVIRENGHAMSAEELFSIISSQYPGKTRSVDTVAAAARNNPNVKPVGRASIYTLKEWVEGEDRSGTIRDFALEYLLSLDTPIAVISEIGDYVRKFRPTSSDRSIQSNLLMESSGRFALYTKNKITYVGLSSYDYDPSYVKFNAVYTPKRASQTSFSLLEEFIQKNNHFPFFTTDDPEERRLSRFWHNITHAYNNNTINNEDRELVDYMIEKYGHLKLGKFEYEWKQKIAEIERVIYNDGIHGLSNEDKEWLTKYAKLYQYGRTTDWQSKSLDKVIKFISKCSKT